MGATTIVVALPWLINNRLCFGSIVPISGQAEALDAKFAANAHVVPPALAEYICGVILIPKSLEGQPVVIAAATILVLGAIAALVWLWRNSNTTIRTLILLTGIYGVGLCGFYGLYFGAEYFMSRYLFPLSPFLALLWVAVLLGFMRAIGRQWGPRLGIVTVAAAMALVCWLNYRIYAAGPNHMHFQVVDWVDENVPSDVWVGAVQSGTVGYFHDKTINLDGKVNPIALEAQQRRRLPYYVNGSRIDYLVDWAGLADWAKTPQFQSSFALILEDRDRGEMGIAVLKRLSARGKSRLTHEVY
ncbi:MAG: hypothetical protein IPK83_03460 [Planctomycetes bacterium]|nr:hypothetical protein [Planctomycetota bacterium]